MSLYPSLEDMKVDQMARAQVQAFPIPQQQIPVTPTSLPPYPPPPTDMPSNPPQYSTTPRNSSPKTYNAALYPALTDYMGLDLTPEFLAQYMPEVANQQVHSAPTTPNAVAIPPPNQVAIPRTTSGLIAPLSGSSVGLKRAEVTHGIREVVLCKDNSGKIGVRVKDVSKGVFVALVKKGSPSAMVGLRFGDQILQINGETVAGYTVNKVHELIKKLSGDRIVMAVRDRPFERTVTLHKDSVGRIGFGYKDGKITSIVKDSSAARNGLLIDHHLLEVNGQNVVGLKDKEITPIIDEGGKVITVTLMPSFLYDHMMKQMNSSLVKNWMDHSIPDI